MAFEVNTTEVDGVRTFWTNGGGPATAILSFRVGVADEAALDGFRIDVEKKEWRDGQRIIDAIDRAIPSALVACEEHSPGVLENRS